MKQRDLILCKSGAIAMMVAVLGGCISAPHVEQKPVVASWRTVQLPQPVATPEKLDSAPEDAIPTTPATEYFGGAMEKTPASHDKAARPKERSKRIELNFQDADVRAVVDAILGDMLKLSYSVSPQVQGKITLRTGRPILYDSALPALEAALSTVSATLVAEDATIQVIPLESAPQRMRRAQRFDRMQSRVPGFAVEIVPLRYVSAKEIQRVLDSFAPKGSILQADEAHQHLVIAGSSQDRAAIVQTVEGFDADWMKGMSFALYKVEQTDPEQLISELKQVFLPPLELVTNRVRLVPISRLQSILGISKYRADLEMLEPWVRRLDGASKNGDRRVYVYNVQNGNAKDLSKSLQLVISGEVITVEASTKSAASSLPEKAQSSQAITTIVPKGNQTRIVANEENNSLLIYATEQEYKTMREALRQLDVMPRQVMIEAIIAEVTLGDNLRYGVQWFFNAGENTITLSNADVGTVNPQFPGFSFIYSGLADARLVLNALKTRTDVKILSSPKLAVLNNQKAELQVGDQIPILSQQAQGVAAPGAPLVTSIQMRDTGVILEVTPRISDNGNVILEVAQEVSDVASTTTSNIDSPTIQRRRLRSVVATRDGATVALGGLIRDARTNGRSGVPLLADLPVLGNLFRSINVDQRRTELIVLLVAHVMRDHQETQAVVNALLDSMPLPTEVTQYATPLLPKIAP